MQGVRVNRYQDEPIEVDYLMAHWCGTVRACYIKRYPQTVDFHICPHWLKFSKYHDPNEDVVTCPQCAGDLSRPYDQSNDHRRTER